MDDQLADKKRCATAADAVMLYLAGSLVQGVAGFDHLPSQTRRAFDNLDASQAQQIRRDLVNVIYGAMSDA